MYVRMRNHGPGRRCVFHDIRFRVESLSHPQLRIYNYFVEFFPVEGIYFRVIRERRSKFEGNEGSDG